MAPPEALWVSFWVLMRFGNSLYRLTMPPQVTGAPLVGSSMPSRVLELTNFMQVLMSFLATVRWTPEIFLTGLKFLPSVETSSVLTPGVRLLRIIHSYL